MYASKIVMLAVTVVCVFNANADTLETWGDGSQGTDWNWIPAQNRLIILQGDGNDYKFWFHDGGDDPSTGVIDNITVDPNAAGDFSLTIGYPADPNDPNSPLDPNTPGALNWNEGDLTYAGGTSTIFGAKLAGSMCANGPLLVDMTTGPLIVEGEILDDVTINTLGGDIVCENMRNLTMHTTASEPHPPDITIEGRVAHPSRSDGWGRDFVSFSKGVSPAATI